MFSAVEKSHVTDYNLVPTRKTDSFAISKEICAIGTALGLQYFGQTGDSEEISRIEKNSET